MLNKLLFIIVLFSLMIKINLIYNIIIYKINLQSIANYYLKFF